MEITNYTMLASAARVSMMQFRPEEGYLRLCFASTDETVEAALDRFGDLVRRQN